MIKKQELEIAMFKVALVFLFILMIADIYTTIKGVEMFGIEAEMNPLMRLFLFSFPVFMTAKMTYSIIILIAILELTNWSERIGYLCIGMGIGCYLTTVISNLMVIL